RIRVIKVRGGSFKRYASLGELVTVAVKEATPHAAVKKGDVLHAVIVRTHKEVGRPDGTHIRFDDNAGIIVDPKSKDMKGTRVFGPVAREVKAAGYTKIASLAPEVL
ncbi:MAG: 50S ribosomal protein L14, partial [Candidatus Kerfeldbacteria bacterium]|nr:50S ribosomal protein L14 [Candidatus Kerfeldbacteria bacterium]